MKWHHKEYYNSYIKRLGTLWGWSPWQGLKSSDYQSRWHLQARGNHMQSNHIMYCRQHKAGKFVSIRKRIRYSIAFNKNIISILKARELKKRLHYKIIGTPLDLSPWQNLMSSISHPNPNPIHSVTTHCIVLDCRKQENRSTWEFVHQLYNGKL